MNKKEYLSAVNSATIMQDRIEAISKIYGVEINNTVAGVISLADQIDFFDEERRALSYAEIFNPVRNLKIDFVKLQAIPLIDAYDNTYIVYMIQDEKWGKFNSIDNVFFKRRSTLAEVL